MATKMTRQEFLEKIFHEKYDELKNKDQLRVVRLRVPGKEIPFAHVIGTSQTCVYRNLGLHIGVHLGEDHTGESIGLIRFTPWECVPIAADIAVKSGDVEIGFMDRFCGTLIITGELAEVRSSVEAVVAFFRDELHFVVCDITET